jgi:hypothetical protein
MHAKAPYIIVMPDDDFVTENFFDLVIEAFENNPNLGIVHSYLDPVERHRHVTERGNGLDSYPNGIEAVSKIFMYSGAAPGLAFRKEALNYKEFLLDQSIYPQVRIATHAALNWGLGLIRSGSEYIDLGGLEDNVVIRATDAMSRPADFGVVERFEILLSVKKQLPQVEANRFYLKQGGSLLKWAANIWQAMECLDPKYAKRMIKALMANKEIRVHPAFIYTLMLRPNIWRSLYALISLSRLVISPKFWANLYIALRNLSLAAQRKK